MDRTELYRNKLLCDRRVPNILIDDDLTTAAKIDALDKIGYRIEQSQSSETTDELIKNIIQGAEDFKNHHNKPYDNNTLKNCLIELRNKIESSEGEGKEKEYPCKVCGAKFNTRQDLREHCNDNCIDE